MLWTGFIAWFLATTVYSADTVDALLDALPKETQTMVAVTEVSSIDGLLEGLDSLVQYGFGQVEVIVQGQLKTVALILLTVILCGLVEGFHADLGSKNLALPMVGALSVSLLSAGSVESMLGLGTSTIGTLETFSHVLLPTMAAATAASGAVTSASVSQVTTVFFVDLLISAINDLLLPMVYLYIGAITASAMLQKGNPMDTLASVMKRGITWLLCTGLFVFTVYLSLVRVVAGSVDGVSVKVARTAISGVIPVVGNIIADASETVLAGAGVLKNTVGIVGTLGILGCCVYPFLQLGVQYLLYKITAFLASLVGPPSLCKLIDGLGGAFGLVLGMTGACALLLLISVLSSVAAVVP